MIAGSCFCSIFGSDVFRFVLLTTFVGGSLGVVVGLSASLARFRTLSAIVFSLLTVSAAGGVATTWVAWRQLNSGAQDSFFAKAVEQDFSRSYSASGCTPSNCENENFFYLLLAIFKTANISDHVKTCVHKETNAKAVSAALPVRLKLRNLMRSESVVENMTGIPPDLYKLGLAIAQLRDQNDVWCVIKEKMFSSYKTLAKFASFAFFALAVFSLLLGVLTAFVSEHKRAHALR